LYINSNDAGLTKQLVSSSSKGRIDRYQQISLDERKSLDQLADFFTFFTWFTLITMIVAAFFGIGVVFE
jgi:hypothetical protein